MKVGAYIIAGVFFLLWIYTDIPFGFLVVAVLLAYAVLWLKQGTHEKALQTLRDVDLMSGEEFEHFVARLFQKLGYKTEVTQKSGDYGADVVASRLNRGHLEKIVIQCKRYQNKVGIGAVQEVVGAKAYYKADKAYVVTNHYYTNAAITLAKSNHVTLWDRHELETQIAKVNQKEAY